MTDNIERQQLEQAIAHLERQRAVLGDTVVDTALAALRLKLQALAAAAPPAAPQRKLITVLFADTSGFTSLSETMDAEEIGDTMNALWQLLDAAIVARGGTIDKHMGDAVMALWGAGTTREDDAEQAVRAALDMQSRIAGFCRAQQVSLAIRIGINTGPVVLGEVGTTHEFTAIGDTVNVAARLQSAAPPGGILIAHDTFRHVRGAFDARALDPLTVKGKQEPVRVYLVERARVRAFRTGARGLEGVETRMVGREAELRRLQGLYAEMMAARDRRVALIAGEAGIGKSRLLHEFDVWADLQPETYYYFKARARPETRGVPYGLLRELLAYRFQIEDSDSTPVVWEKMEAGIAESAAGDAAMRAHFIGQLLGFDFRASPCLQEVLGTPGREGDPRQLRNRAMAYLADYFRALTGNHAVMVLLDDLHWADDSSLEAVVDLARRVTGCPVLIVATTRPALFEQQSGWGGGVAGCLRLDLRPLSRDESERLIVEILQQADTIPGTLCAMIADRAEGNPFYVEELVKVLIDDGVVTPGEERWHIDLSRLAAARMPQTLAAVLQARFDTLPGEERKALQRAAVYGRVFWDEGVAFLDARGTLRETQGALAELQRREIVFPRDSSAFAGAREYTFKHALLRETTYTSILKRDRQAYHARAAEWLSRRSAGRADEWTGPIAEHLALAGNTAEAAAYLERAGRQAADRYANAEAAEYFGRALELLPADAPAGRYTLLMARAQAYHRMGLREPQQRDLDALLALAPQLAPAQQAQIALHQAELATATGDYPATITAAQRAIDMAHAAGQAALESSGYQRWGEALVLQSNYPEARVQLEQGLALARRGGAGRIEALCLSALGSACRYLGDYDKARAHLLEALAICRAIGDRQEEANRLNGLGVTAWYQGDYAGAQDYYRQAIEIHRAVGNRRNEGAACNNLGTVAHELGDYAAAWHYYEQALRIAVEIGDRQGEGTTLNNLGSTGKALGYYAAARDYYTRSRAIMQEIGERWGEATALANLGAAAYDTGDYPAALDFDRQALQITREIGDPSLEAFALTYLGEAEAAAGRLDAAEKNYRQALEIRERLEQPQMALEPQTGLAGVLLARGDAAGALKLMASVLADHARGDFLAQSEAGPWIYLALYRVLAANADPRASEVLRTAAGVLLTRAAKIDDAEVRRTFLQDVTHHREIMRLAEALPPTA